MTNEEIVEIVEEAAELDAGEVSIDDELQKIDNWGSLAIMVLISVVDERFSVVLPAEKIGEAKTVADLKALIEKSQAS